LLTFLSSPGLFALPSFFFLWYENCLERCVHHGVRFRVCLFISVVSKKVASVPFSWYTDGRFDGLSSLLMS